MAGHNKWSKVKHRKAVVDKRRSKAWTMCSRAIMVAARSGGPDPEFNFALRQALDDAKYHNVPKDNVERAIKKGAGGGEGENYEAVRYEGYGPAGVAVVVEALTNNRTRTAADLRLIFGKYGGNLGATGCVSFVFEAKGRIVVDAPRSDEERLFEAAAGAGADDIRFEDDEELARWAVLTGPTALAPARQAIERAGFKVEQARLEHIPTTLAAIEGEEARRVLEFVEALEDNDDVQNVYVNADIPEDVLEAYAS